VVCKRGDPKACYVKGSLMPTRAIGDLRLKHPEFNFHESSEKHGYRRSIPVFKGPYITHEPDIQVIPLSSEDKYLVMASDGLWDEISRKTSAKVATRLAKENAIDSLMKTLCQEALKQAAKNSGITMEQLSRMEPGDYRRQVVDDITIFVVDLKN
jgi:pyruvate dehydrogenase phosphatase